MKPKAERVSISRMARYQLIPPYGCPTIFPVQSCPPCPCTPGLLKAETYQFTAFSDGMKNVYTDSDAAGSFSTSGILGPNDVTVTNLFINGILQSPNLYAVQTGVLVLSDVPAKGVPLILQFIKIMT